MTTHNNTSVVGQQTQRENVLAKKLSPYTTRDGKTESDTDDSTVSDSFTGIETPENLLRQTITEHSNYTDSEGNTGTDPNWFLFQIKKRITEGFGKHPNEIPENELSDLYDALVYIILEGEKSGLTRPEIKGHLYSSIDTYVDNNLKGEVK